MITQKQLKDKLRYDKDTGKFFRVVATSSNAKEGYVAGTIDSYGYVVIRVLNKRYKAHRLAYLYETGSFPPDSVDHIDMVKTNNRWDNLRLVTRSENLRLMHLSKKCCDTALSTLYLESLRNCSYDKTLDTRAST